MSPFTLKRVPIVAVPIPTLPEEESMTKAGVAPPIVAPVFDFEVVVIAIVKPDGKLCCVSVLRSNIVSVPAGSFIVKVLSGLYVPNPTWLMELITRAGFSFPKVAPDSILNLSLSESSTPRENLVESAIRKSKIGSPFCIFKDKELSGPRVSNAYIAGHQ